MMPISRQDIEILLDTPSQHDYVISAYVDMRVQDGFNRDADRHLKNEERAVGEALAAAEARKDLEANMAVIREAVQAQADSPARGLAIFSGLARGLRQVIPLDFPVDNHLVIDEEPFLLPLLEHWYGAPSFLVALCDANEAHLFEMHHGALECVGDLKREDADQPIQRDKPRFTYKKRFAATDHERLHGPEDAPFLRDVADSIGDRWNDGHFAGLILFGHSQDVAALRKLLPRELDALVVGTATHAMPRRPEDLIEDASRLVSDWEAEHERRILAELNERWKQDHRVANGATEVLDALQQGRAVQVLLGTRRDIPGARCTDCGYRFGAPVAVCPYCQGSCRAVNAVQDIMRLAMRHRVDVHRFHVDAQGDPLGQAGGVAALIRAASNWAPEAEAPRASEGHAQIV